MNTQRVTRIYVAAVVVAGGVLSPATASASSPNPASACVGQLSQGATPHGTSAADPGFLGSFVSALARSGPGAYGALSSTLAKEHGDLSACVSALPPRG